MVRPPWQAGWTVRGGGGGCDREGLASRVRGARREGVVGRGLHLRAIAQTREHALIFMEEANALGPTGVKAALVWPSPNSQGWQKCKMLFMATD